MANNKCWICGKPADSGEHSIKKSNFKTLFGTTGPYKNENELCLVRDGKLIPIQSANSKHLKFNVLCKYCNNTRTQPFDKAYEKFIKYVEDHQEEILKIRFIDFSSVYGENFEEGQRNLYYKYLVKSFASRLARFGHPIPQDMIDLLDKDYFKTGLRITFAINEDKALLSIIDKDIPVLSCGDIYGNKDYIDKATDLVYFYSESYSWLEIFYWYNSFPDGSLGSTWVADNRFVYLGSFQSQLSNEQYYEFLTKAIVKNADNNEF